MARFQHGACALQRERGNADAARSQRQARRHPLLHHHDRRLAARHSRQRPWRRSRCDRLGHVRGRPCRRVRRYDRARAARASKIIQMLIDGELDAVLGEKIGPSGPEAAVCRRRRGRESLVRQTRRACRSTTWWWSAGPCPSSIRKWCGKCSSPAARKRARAPAGRAAVQRDAMRRSLEMIIGYSAQQRLIPRAFAVDELFDDVTRTL